MRIIVCRQRSTYYFLPGKKRSTADTRRTSGKGKPGLKLPQELGEIRQRAAQPQTQFNITRYIFLLHNCHVALWAFIIYSSLCEHWHPGVPDPSQAEPSDFSRSEDAASPLCSIPLFCPWRRCRAAASHWPYPATHYFLANVTALCLLSLELKQTRTKSLIPFMIPPWEPAKAYNSPKIRIKVGDAAFHQIKQRPSLLRFPNASRI